MSSHQPDAPQSAVEDHEPIEQDEWLDDPLELPQRPRRRLLAPLPLGLLAALLIACGFIGGVLVQKGQEGGGSSASAGAGAGFASRLAALRSGGGASATGFGGGASRAGSAAPGGSVAPGGAFAASGASGAGAITTGEVAYVRGNTLYVTDSQGNTVKVTAAAGAKVTKTVSTKAGAIHPGATVVVLGSKAKNGSVSASSIAVRSTTSSSASAAGASSAGATTGPSAAPTLFGPG